MSDDANSAPVRRIGAARPALPPLAPRESCWDVILQDVGKKLEKRGFEVSIASSLQDAADYVQNVIVPQNGPASVAFGGSMTVASANLHESLKNVSGLEVMPTLFAGSQSPEELMEVRRKALLCDLFLCSVNAMTREGEMLMVDGFGNRTAAVQFGPRKVVLLVGRNKICPSRDSAVERIKYLAAPANGVRLNKDTPCAKVGRCADCNSPGRMCSYWSLIQRCNPRGRIHVILIDEEAGY